MSEQSAQFLRGRRAGRMPIPLRDRGETSGKGSEAATASASTASAGTASPRAGSPLRATYTPREVPPYRRRSVKPRRRRRSWTWLRPLLTMVFLMALGVGSVGFVVTSPRFQVSAVEVQGEVPALTGWVERRVTPFVGEPLLVLSLSRVLGAVGDHPWIDTLEISRVLPNRLLVIVHERQPVALLEVEGDGWMYADRLGRPIAPLADPGPGAPAAERLTGLLRVRGGWDDHRGVPEALAICQELTRAHSGWGSGVFEVEVLSERDFRLRTAALGFPILVRSGEVQAKIQWLDRMLPQLVSRWGEPAVLDLRFARRIVLEEVIERVGERQDIVEKKSERLPERGA